MNKEQFEIIVNQLAKTMESINNVSKDMDKVIRNYPTLRDQFAMSAMAAFAGGSWNGTPMSMVIEDEYNVTENLAIAAYKVADAMLGARENLYGC